MAPPDNWPMRGKILMENISARYDKDLDPVLRDININIQPGQKVILSCITFLINNASCIICRRHLSDVAWLFNSEEILCKNNYKKNSANSIACFTCVYALIWTLEIEIILSVQRALNAYKPSLFRGRGCHVQGCLQFECL